MTGKLLTEHHLEFLSLKRECTGSSESTLVKMCHCWESHVTAQIGSGWELTDDRKVAIEEKPANMSCDLRFPTMWHLTGIDSAASF